MTRAEDVLRYAYRQGPGRDIAGAGPLGTPEGPPTTTFGTLPRGIATDRMCNLVWGTVDLLEATAYPTRCPDLDLPVEARLQHALVIAFGLQRREPSNLFNDHRATASVRSRFPVHAFVHTDDNAWFLDVYRHGLLPVGDACPQWPQLQPVNVALAGRFTHLPSLYGRLRGPLTELELGISLRALWAALEVLGLGGELRLPGRDTGQLMTRLELDPRAEWSLPLTVAVCDRPAALRDGAPGAGPDDCDDVDDVDDDYGGGDSDTDEYGHDPTLAEVVAVNRTSRDAVESRPRDAARGGAQAIPDGVPVGTGSWSEVLWNRSAGRMPRHLAGVSGRRRPCSGTVVRDAVAWVAAPPPTALLGAIAGRITVTACLQDAEGFAPGWYRLDRDRPPDGGPRLDLVHADPSLPLRLEGCYGHGTGPEVGCAVRHANMIWLLSSDVASLIEEFGPGGWTLAQHACGWMAHGLCLAAAAHGLYARPSRAFEESALQAVGGLAAGEIVLLSVVSGAGRFRELTLDLRT